MEIQERINILTKWREKLLDLAEEEINILARQAEQNNPWFTKSNILFSLKGITELLREDELKTFIDKYNAWSLDNKTLGLVLAGNIPAVGFHDVLIGVLAGCQLKVKMSSEDSVLLPFLMEKLQEISPELVSTISLVPKLNLDHLDGVVATGSDNTARYFEQYFSRKPNLIRKSRISLAVLNGKETEEELEFLCDDIFLYFGLGCRNVSKLLVLGDADLIPLLKKLEARTEVNNFSKYDNNYLYYKSIYLVNREEFLDTETIMLKETDEMHSPISVLYYQRFQTEKEIAAYIENNDESIQCVVGQDQAIGFGEAQQPGILDYADGIDLRAFIHSL